MTNYSRLGIDTNVLVRYLARDDQLQYEKARRLINREVSKGEPVMVSLPVLLETEWVLRSRYELAKAEVLAAVSALLDAADLAFTTSLRSNTPSIPGRTRQPILRIV
jgi:predicted nucleic-acid-binding protein